jgi:putative SOS response-associated peptidase YedK
LLGIVQQPKVEPMSKQSCEVPQPFAFAGLWESWRGAGDGPPLESCAILTTEANELTAKVHNRMPVILDPADHVEWLAGSQIPLVPFPANRMTARRVSTYVNNARNEGPGVHSAAGRITIWSSARHLSTALFTH